MKKIWDSNPGQIDDFRLMRFFCLSIYIKNITYLTTVTQKIKKNRYCVAYVFIHKYHLLFWLGISTQSVNLVSGVSHTAR